MGVRQVGPDLWELTVSLGKDRVTNRYGRRSKRVHVSGVRAARAELATFTKELQAARIHAPTQKFGELAEAWISSAPLAESTAYRYKGMMRRTVLPKWGGRKAADITAPMLEDWYADLRRAGMAPGTLHLVHAMTSSIFKYGVKRGVLAHNVATAASPGGMYKPDIQPPSVAEVTALMEAASDPSVRMLLLLSAHLGTRRGETCGLQWGDVDLEGKRVRVERSITAIPNPIPGSKNHGIPTILVKSTKTHAADWLSIPSSVCVSLEFYRTWCEARAWDAGAVLGLGSFLFSQDPAGMTPWTPDMATARFVKLRKSLGLSHVTLKNLRHFHATQLIANGVDVRTVAGRLRHATPMTTLNFYAKFDRGADRRAAELMGGLLPPGE